jgi:hypothetical protein
LRPRQRRFIFHLSSFIIVFGGGAAEKIGSKTAAGDVANSGGGFVPLFLVQ